MKRKKKKLVEVSERTRTGANCWNLVKIIYGTSIEPSIARIEAVLICILDSKTN